MRIKNKTTCVVSIQCLAQRKTRYSYNLAAMAENLSGIWGEDTQVRVKPQAQTPVAQTRHSRVPWEPPGTHMAIILKTFPAQAPRKG